ncbi:MAG TPA: hypothetical protein VNL17_10760 [Verrucomicrobiae bacterium]|nr:hypothetical protein [Verrucomicrobiae bacterium]
MGNSKNSVLERRLQRKIIGFLDADSRWSRGLAQLSKDIRSRGYRAFLFGGCLRDLMLSRSGNMLPRDIDLVVDVPSVQELEEIFGAAPKRITRFGGVAFDLDCLSIDVWPLGETWAFKNGFVGPTSFKKLPSTTFLNIEAIVAELTFKDGQRPQVYEDGFFSAISERKLEIRLEQNPFPDACIARALSLGARLGYSLGQNLTRYIVDRIPHTTPEEIEERQIVHYGHFFQSAEVIDKWFRDLTEMELFYRGSITRVPTMEENQCGFSCQLVHRDALENAVTPTGMWSAVNRMESKGEELRGVVVPSWEPVDMWTWPFAHFGAETPKSPRRTFYKLIFQGFENLLSQRCCQQDQDRL